jgi:hypothetical protein
LIRLAVGICFPHIGKWIAETPDPRREHPSRKYELSLMIWTAMVMFVSQPGTRRQYDLDKGTTAFLLNVLALAGLPPDSASRLPTAEAVDDVLRKLDEDVFAKLRKSPRSGCSDFGPTPTLIKQETCGQTQKEDVSGGRIIKALIRGKRIESCKFNGFWRLAVDATSIHTSSKRHCPHGQTKTCSKTKITTYYHNVLEFKLVSPDGLALSIHSEFLVRQDGESKQDSEIKVFHRAAPEIKRMWPHMRFIIMGDAAYGNVNFMRICKDNDWQYCVSLKDNLPTLRKAADAGLASAKPKLHKIFKSMKNFVKRLAEAFRFNPPTWTDIAELGPIQLRRLTL